MKLPLSNTAHSGTVAAISTVLKGKYLLSLTNFQLLKIHETLVINQSVNLQEILVLVHASEMGIFDILSVLKYKVKTCLLCPPYKRVKLFSINYCKTMLLNFERRQEREKPQDQATQPQQLAEQTFDFESLLKFEHDRKMETEEDIAMGSGVRVSSKKDAKQATKQSDNLFELSITVTGVDFVWISQKQHNVYRIEVRQKRQLVSQVQRRKSDFKKLHQMLHLQTTIYGGKHPLDKHYAKEIPDLPWFFRPLALFSRELSSSAKEGRRQEFEEYLQKVVDCDIARENYFLAFHFLELPIKVFKQWYIYRITDSENRDYKIIEKLQRYQ